MAGKGRPKRKLIDIMRTQLWVHQLKHLTHSRTFYKLNEKFGTFSTNYSTDYANGKTGVNSTTLKLIDQDLKKIYGFKSRKASDFYYIGPTVEDDGEIEHVKLWDALTGPIEGLWDILFWYDFSTELQHEIGSPFNVKINRIKASLFTVIDPPSEWIQKDKGNCIAEAYINGVITVDLRLLTAVIAVWRLANFMKDKIYLANYMLIGLLDKAAEDLLSPLAPKSLDEDDQDTKTKKSNNHPSFYSNFLQLLIDIDTPQVQRFNEVIDKFNGFCREYPNQVEHEDDSESIELSRDDGFEHFRANLQGTRVSEFLIMKREKMKINTLASR